MTRNELLITSLALGGSSTGELAGATGLSERVGRAGPRHLVNEGYVWSPECGRYGLTRTGHPIAAEVAPTAGRAAMPRRQRPRA
jgi:hypothetical protein